MQGRVSGVIDPLVQDQVAAFLGLGLTVSTRKEMVGPSRRFSNFSHGRRADKALLDDWIAGLNANFANYPPSSTSASAFTLSDREGVVVVSRCRLGSASTTFGKRRPSKKIDHAARLLHGTPHTCQVRLEAHRELSLG